MKKILFQYFVLAAILLLPSTAPAASKASSVTQRGLTWTFDKEHEVGQFVNGDWWVVGPVNIIDISNDIQDKAFLPTDGAAVNGSMISPKPPAPEGTRHFTQLLTHGYDARADHYDPALNAAMPRGKPIAKNNPLKLGAGQKLVSGVSWLWRSKDDREPDCKAFTGEFAWPILRTAMALTCLEKPAPDGSFRPSYSGGKKEALRNVKDLRFDRLLNLDLAGPAPDIADLTRRTERVWLDHVTSWWGWGVFNPSENLPNYGREKAWILQQAMLALHLDWKQLDGQPSKKELAINLAQIGIDLAGVADAGGFWGEDGGHAQGRKPAILFAALLLDDAHMKTVGNWKTAFQDNNQTFYVSKEDIARGAAKGWYEHPRLDKRGSNIMPYKKEMLGMPEWGIRHASVPEADNAGWNTPYRDINAAAIPGFALIFMMMEDGRKLFKHEAYFDYADRLKSSGEALFNPWHNRPSNFVQAMWAAYRGNYPSTYDKKWDAPEITEYITTPKPE